MKDTSASKHEEATAIRRTATFAPLVCPACGARAHRPRAHFCSTCGRTLAEGDYLPADALHASYHGQHRPAAAPARRERRGAVTGKLHAHETDWQATRPTPTAAELQRIMTGRNLNGASTTALAFLTYSLVPYLGIIFPPGAIVMG